MGKAIEAAGEAIVRRVNPFMLIVVGWLYG